MALQASAVRAGLATRLATLGRVVTAPDQVTPPCLVIGQPTAEYDASFSRGLDRLEVPVHAVMPRISDRAAVAQLDAWLAGTGGTSVKAVVEADRTLGGAAQTCRVVRAVPGSLTTGSGDMPAYEFTVEVHG